MADDGNDDEYGGFDGYVETTVDPSPYMLIFTCIFCFGVMLVVVPLMTRWKLRRRKHHQAQTGGESTEMDYSNMATAQIYDSEKESERTESEEKITFKSILNFDKETRKILGLAIPFTISGLSSSIFSNICLALVGNYIGTHAIAAYSLVSILVGLSDGVLQGPIYACTTLCAHAVGSGNTTLAGQYIQMATLLYLLLNIPAMYFWCNYMKEVILYLQWGEEETAQMAEEYINVYLFSYLLGGVSSSVWQLLEVTGHVVAGTVVSIIWGAVNALAIGILVTTGERTLQDVGVLYSVSAIFFVFATHAFAELRGWLKPFRKGLYRDFSLFNGNAIKLMVKQAVPLSFGSLLSNAEWAVLTFFASHLGPAEVAAWAILGSIWDMFYVTTSGIGDAAEIRVSLHFGENKPGAARLCGYKALLLSMSVATIVSLIFVSLQNRLPAWFTVDKTLQAMLLELVPFVGVANLTMQFGMTSWSLIGAQGKYKLATWISFISSWGAAMPLSAVSVYVFHFNLQGLTAAVVIGYVSTGAALSYVLLSTNWKKVAKKIQDQNAETAAGEDSDTGERAEEELYAAMQTRRQACKAAARRNICLLSLPPGQRSGLIFGNVAGRPGTHVLVVKSWSQFWGTVRNGDSVLALNGQDVTKMDATEISSKLNESIQEERLLSFASPKGGDIYDEDEFVVHQIAADETKSFDQQLM